MIDTLSRQAMHDLEQWNANPRRKPLLLRGARQTGKTWLVSTFGAAHFDSVARIDFMRDNDARSLFDASLAPQTLLTNISLYTGITIDPEHTLIFLDEIQECPRALTALKYFCEEAPQYHVIATGSYMGISRHADASFPVGKVDIVTLYPMTFVEFLANCGEPQLAELIAAGQLQTIPDAFSTRLSSRFKEYMVVGGMPEVVLNHLNGSSALQVREIQQDILNSYDLDFSKYAPPRLLDRIRLVWNTIPSQLAKENRRFVYGALRQGARARDFEESFMWLRDYGVITQVPCVNALRSPLHAYTDPSAFKLFILDVGLLGTLANLDPAIVLQGSALFTEFKGALTEQVVCQQLVAQGYIPCYWTNPKGRAEIDFAVEHHGSIIPIEVKSSLNLRAKSLHVACEQFHLSHAIRTAATDFRDEGWLTNIPLWEIIGLRAFLDSR